MLLLGQNRSMFILFSNRHRVACFHVGNLRSSNFQKWSIFKPSFAFELLTKWIRAKNGKCKERREVCPKRHKWERAIRGSEGGERLKQDRAELHTSFHSCFYLSSMRLTGNALHHFHENFFFYGKNQAGLLINKRAEQNTALGDDGMFPDVAFTLDWCHYLLWHCRLGLLQNIYFSAIAEEKQKTLLSATPLPVTVKPTLNRT